METKQTEIRPQKGFQIQFLSSAADITIGGGAAGLGKSWCLQVSPLRHKEVRRFNSIIFRRTTEQIRNPGSLWDKSEEIYPYFGFMPNVQQLEWTLKRTAVTLKFAHLQYEKNIYDHDGSEYCLVGFDELQHFTRKQFFYLLTRNRSTCGVRPYLLATCNPDPDSFLAKLLEWWIDQQEFFPSSHEKAGEKNPHWGFPYPERVGKLRYMVTYEDKWIWGDSKAEILKSNPEIFSSELMKDTVDPNSLIKSVTFITGKLKDNQELLSKNPGYVANLMSQDETERLRLLEGNWKIRASNSCIFTEYSIENLFTNNWPASTSDRFISCDAARFGADLCTIFVWYGWKVIKLIIISKSDRDEIIDAIEKERERYSITKSHVIVDQDGVGGGVVKAGHYIGFSGNDHPLEDPGTFIKENYFNMKTQFYYRFAEKVNEDAVAIQLSNDNVVIDGNYNCKIKINGVVEDVRELIKQDLRAIRSKDADKDGKKKINGKDEQKALLGRSPDFADGMMIRIWYDFRSGSIRAASPRRRRSLLDYIH